MSDVLQSAPAVGVIDENNIFTLNWQPFLGPDGTFDQYAGWDIVTKAGAFAPQTVTKSAVLNPDETPTSRFYTTVLAASEYTMTMKADAILSAGASDSSFWETSGDPTVLRAFPSIFISASVAFDNTTLLLGQQLNVTLNAGYTGADQWQVFWPDGSFTGWLPLSASAVAKQFSVSGAQIVRIQTRRDYSGNQYNPPTTLIRQLSQQIFVMDQQATSVSATSSGLTSTLGFGGTEGFEIIDNSANVAAPQPWEVIARGLVRDSVTNELKLLVATSRFVNASSLLGTMAIDVFPVEGRPHVKELLAPVFEIITNSATSSVPVKIQTSTLPNIIVGKSINDALGGALVMSVKASTGVPDFIWAATGLPLGVFMGSNGVISGTPLVMGQFNVTFSVQDSGLPFSIDEVALPLIVETDLQVKKHGFPATDLNLGTVTIGIPYSQQMDVGNIVGSSLLPGGLAPYQWSTPAGSLPVGITINPTTGLLSGVPSTYNSTTDFFAVSGKIFSVVIQVTDAIGAKASNTFSMKLNSATLQFGSIDQPEIFAAQTFKLVVPIFGGQSPYILTVGTDVDNVSSPAATFNLIDGQVEVVLNIPGASAGVQSIILRATDSATGDTGPIQINYRVDTEISSIRFVEGFIHKSSGDPGAWTFSDSSSSVPIVVAGDLTGFVLAGQRLVASNGLVVTLDPLTNQFVVGTAANPTPPPALATLFRNAELRVPIAIPSFFITGSVTSLGTLTPPTGFIPFESIIQAVTNATSTVVGTITGSNPLTVGSFSIGGADNSNIWTGTISGATYTPTAVPVANPVPGSATISRPYTLLAHNDSTDLGTDIGTISTFARPYIVGDSVGLNPRKPYFNSPDVHPNDIRTTPATPWTASVQPGSTLPPGLSLDTNTGLIYGVLTGTFGGTSIVQYADGAGTLHGAITINWTTYASDFELGSSFIDGVLYTLGAPTVYTTGIPLGTIGPSSTPLTNASVVGGSLPTGLSVVLDGTNTNALVTGTPTEAGYFDVWFLIAAGAQNCYIYKRIVVAHPTALTITTPSPLPNATASTAYSFQMQAAGGTGGPYTWKISPDPNGVSPGILFSAVDPTYGTGAFSGSASAHVAQNYTITVNDGSNTVSGTFSLTVQASGLVINKVTIPAATSGIPYSTPLTASGSGSTPYTWSISPASLNNLPAGLTLASSGPTSATISGTTTLTGFNKVVIFRVTDSTTLNYFDQPITVQVVAGLTLFSGVDYSDSPTPGVGPLVGLLGKIDNGNTTSIAPRPNDAFFVVATGVVSTLPSQITVTTSNPAITGTVTSLAGGIAFIQLSGSFNGGSPGTYSIQVTVVDSGVNVTTTFSWTVYDDGVLRLAAINAFPTQLV